MALLKDGFCTNHPPSLTRGSNMLHYVEYQMSALPNRPAVWEKGVHTSFSELNSYSSELARQLAPFAPLGSSQSVGVLCERSVDLIACQIAILKHGCVFVPIDIAYPAERIAFILQDSGACCLLCQERTRQHVPQGYNGPIVVVDKAALNKKSSEALRCFEPADSSALCYIMYTSGTTGNPKGVRVMHKGVLNYIETWRQWTRCSETDRVMVRRSSFVPPSSLLGYKNITPPSTFPKQWFAGVAFDASIENIYCTLSSGACVVVRSLEWLEDLKECTMMDCTPSALTIVNPVDYPKLRFVSTGAEELQVELRRYIFFSFFLFFFANCLPNSSLNCTGCS